MTYDPYSQQSSGDASNQFNQPPGQYPDPAFQNQADQGGSTVHSTGADPYSPNDYGQSQYGQPGYPQPGVYPQQGQYGPPPGGSTYGYQNQPYGQQPAAFGTPMNGSLPQQAYASWGRRVGAYVLDALPLIPGQILMTAGMTMSNATAAPVDPYSGTPATTPDAGMSGTGVGLLLVGLVLNLAIQIWNRWINGGKGASWGKKVMGLRLVDGATGQPIGTGRAFLRDIAHVLDSIPLYLGYLWPLWDAKRQTFSDKVCNTVVLPQAPQPMNPQPGYPTHV